MIFVDRKAPKLTPIDLPWDGPEASDAEFVADSLRAMRSMGYDEYLRGCRKWIEDNFAERTDDAQVKDQRRRIVERMRYAERKFSGVQTDGSFARRLDPDGAAMLKAFAAADMRRLVSYADELRRSGEESSGRGLNDADNEESEI
jgi:hypothetical protein